jgi:uncharacterized protein YacL
MAAIGWFAIQNTALTALPNVWLFMAVAVTTGVFVVCGDVLAPRTKLSILSGTFLGLVVGMLIAYAASFVVTLLVDQFTSVIDRAFTAEEKQGLTSVINLMVGAVCCYLAISFILQTKDDFRFIIPYVEFRKQTKGTRPIVLDTNVLIDGRITEIVETGFIESQIIVPQFIIDELQILADNSDKLKRSKGRRGLDILKDLRANKKTDVLLYDASARDAQQITDTDHRLVQFAQELNARILTNDMNLRDVAQLRGVDVTNLNELAQALKPVVLPGEKMVVRLIKAGDEPGQGVGYLEDGTMVVVEQGRPHLQEEVEFVVTSAIQTKNGKMIFGRVGDNGSGPRRNQPPSKPRE